MANIQPRGENSFFFTVSLGKGPDGKYKRKTKTIKVEEKMTPKQLKEYLEFEYAKFKQEVLAGEYIAPGKMTLDQFSDEWIKKHAEKEMSETTVASHLNRLKNHVIPSLGHKRIDQIKSMDIINMLDGLKRKDGSEEPLAISTKIDIYKTLSNLFKYAVKWGLIAKNPMDNVDKPKDRNGPYKEVNVYDEQEVQMLLRAAEKELPHWRTFISLLLTTGLRRSEALGLEWTNIDLEKGELDIKQAIVRGRNGAVIKSTKNKSSNRLISLPSSMVNT